jgi:uncharacterized protein (TIGR03437 family)
MTARLKIFGAALLVAGGASAQQYVVSTVAGGAAPPSGVPAASSSVGNTNSVATDAAGNFYFSGDQCVFKVDTTGKLTVIAGNSRRGYSGDGGLAVNAQLYNPYGVAVDASGNVYIADELNNRIRRVSPAGIITTVAGGGTAGFSGDGGPAVQAQLHFPLNVAVDASGNLYISDLFNNRVRKVSPAGIIVTFAGGGVSSPGDGGQATAAAISGPSGITTDSLGDVFVAERSGNRVRKISPAGVISTVAGNGTAGYSGNGGLAVNAELYLPSDVAVDASGDIYIADFNNNFIREVSSAGIIGTVPEGAVMNGPSGVSLDGSGNLYVADRFNNRILKVVANGSATAIAGNGIERFSGDGGPATSAQLNLTTGVALDQLGNLYIADGLNGRVREVSTSGIINTVAGGGAPPGTGDGGMATSAYLVNPQGVAVDSAGNLYIADAGANRVRKVSTGGIITTVAGNGTQGFSGDASLAINAELSDPTCIVVDGSGNLYILDSGNERIREVATNGIITTLAGGGGSTDDGVPSYQAWIAPSSIAVDSAGNLFISDFLTFRIRKVANGTITSVTQTTSAGGLAVDASDNLYVAAATGVQKIISLGIPVPIAGTGVNGFSGDGGPALNAQFFLSAGGAPSGLAVSASGQIYVADTGNYSVRLLQPVSQSAIVAAVVDAASEAAAPVSPGQIVVIYGAGLGPSQAVVNQPVNGVFAANVGGTSVFFNSLPAPILYTSATQITAIVPYGVTGPTAQLTVVYQGQISPALSLPVAAYAPSIFTSNQTGAGQAAAINVVDGTLNSAANPVKIGAYIELFATGEGQTNPAGVDGKVGGSAATHPNANVTATVGQIPATVQYAGGVFGDVAGLMQVNVLIPAGVQPGGYVQVVLQVGTVTNNGSGTPIIPSNLGTWIAVTGN